MESKTKTQTAKEFCKKYNSVFFLVAITALLFFAELFEPLWIVAAVLTFGFFIFLNAGEIVAYTMYFNVFSAIGTYFIASLLCGFVIIVTKYIVGLVKKREKFYVLPFVLTSVFVAFFSAMSFSFGFDSNGALQGALIVALLFVSYFLFVYRKQIMVEKSYKMLVIGLGVSIALGLLSMIIPNFGQKIYYFDGTYKRLRLFCFHQNHLALICLFVCSFYSYKILNKKGHWLVNSIIIVLSMILGFFTLSKAFIVVFAFIILFLIVFAIKRYKLKSLKIILPSLVVMAIFCICAKELVAKVLDRFLAYNTTSSFINRITTGRSWIWYEYFSAISSSIPKMMFGVGLFGKEVLSAGPHNVLIYFLYRTGVTGIVLLCAIAWSYLKAYGGKLKLTFKNCLPLLIYIFIAMEEMIFSDRFYFFFVLALVLLAQKPKQESVTVQTTSNTQIENPPAENKNLQKGGKKIIKNKQK